MCLICNRGSSAVMAVGRDWVELNSVKAAASFLEGWSKAAMMYHHVEVADHLGGDINEITKSGLEAIDHFRKARELYAENVQLVGKYGTEAAVETKASAAAVTFSLASMSSHTNDAKSVIAQNGIKGVFEHLEEKCSDIIGVYRVSSEGCGLERVRRRGPRARYPHP